MGKKLEEKKKENKQHKIKLLIIIISIIVVGIGSFIGYKIYQKYHTVGSEWGDTYYDFIIESKSKKSKKAKIKNNSKIKFLEADESDEPVMIVNYEKNKKEYSDIYFIDDDKVENIISSEPSKIEMLYNLDKKTYDWYVHTNTEDEDKYIMLSKIIDDDNKEDDEYTYKSSDEIVVEKVDETKISMSKFDSEFVNVDVKPNTIDYKEDLSLKDLRDSLSVGVDKYKTNEEIATKKVKEKVIKKEKEIIDTKEEMKKASEEVQKKKEEEAKKAEEERQKALEEEKKGLAVGNYRLKYGKYISDVSKQDSSYYGTLIIKPNGKFHIKANCEGYDYPYKELDNDGTYRVTKIQNSYSYFDGIEFKTDNGVVFGLEVHGDTRLSDQWHGYNYVSAE